MFMLEICKHWYEVHLHECGWYSNCPNNEIPRCELKVHNYLEPKFVLSLIKEQYPYEEPIKRKKTKNQYIKLYIFISKSPNNLETMTS